MQQLNTEGYSVARDNLIAGNDQHIGGRIVEVEVTAGAVTEIKRGQIIDFAEGKYTLHAKSGVPNLIVAETVTVDQKATKVQVEAYDRGTFNTSALITSEALTDEDVERFREKNIILI